MTYEEKLDLILKAIIQARKSAVKEQSVKLYINDDNGLSPIGKDEVRDILYKLEVEEKILSINNTYNRLLPSDQQPKNPSYLLIDIRIGFDKWYSNYLIKNRTRIENLTKTNLDEIYTVLTQIEEQMQIAQSDKFNFGFVASTYALEGYDTEDVDNLIDGYIRVLDYLKKLGVITDYTHGVMSVDADITLNINNYYELLDRVKTVKSQHVTLNPIPPEPTKKDEAKNQDADIVYKIIYTKQRQIILNDDTQIANPDFNSENDLVFSFLYENPHKRFTKEQIEKAIGGKLNKDFHKIIENLGFEGDTKKVFFSVSKNAIEFRNPITKQDLQEIKKPLTRMIKGGGKLVLPPLHR